MLNKINTLRGFYSLFCIFPSANDIKHNQDNFTIIDCCLNDSNKKTIVDEIIQESSSKNISRFISTHPDQDHLAGLEYLNSRNPILNFYCVKNEATKPEETIDFNKYCELRDSDKAFNISKGCKRKWMNEDDTTRKHSGISILWPDWAKVPFQV